MPARPAGSDEAGAALQAMLAEKGALLAAAEERLARLEALQALAQARSVPAPIGRSSSPNTACAAAVLTHALVEAPPAEAHGM